eukprot:1362632-Pleurochrysis_carterae.AAC.3
MRNSTSSASRNSTNRLFVCTRLFLSVRVSVRVVRVNTRRGWIRLSALMSEWLSDGEKEGGRMGRESRKGGRKKLCIPQHEVRGAHASPNARIAPNVSAAGAPPRHRDSRCTLATSSCSSRR